MDVDQAREIMGLEGALTVDRVTARFRVLVKNAHPDSPNGCDEDYIRLCDARDLLEAVLPGAVVEMRETKFQERMIKLLTEAGAAVFNVHGGLMQGRGWPDLIIWHRVWDGCLELKVGGNQLEPAQIKRIKDIRRAGGEAWCLRLRERLTLEHVDRRVKSSMEWGRSGNEILEWLRDNADSV